MLDCSARHRRSATVSVTLVQAVVHEVNGPDTAPKMGEIPNQVPVSVAGSSRPEDSDPIRRLLIVIRF